MCKKWLQKNAKPSKTINYHIGPDSILTQVVMCAVARPDGWRPDDPYVSTGAFIQAAIELGYKWKKADLFGVFLNEKTDASGVFFNMQVAKDCLGRGENP